MNRGWPSHDLIWHTGEHLWESLRHQAGPRAPWECWGGQGEGGQRSRAILQLDLGLSRQPALPLSAQSGCSSITEGEVSYSCDPPQPPCHEPTLNCKENTWTANTQSIYYRFTSISFRGKTVI